MSDSDSNPEKASVPDWQRAEPEDAPEVADTTPASSTTETDAETDSSSDIIATPSSEEDKLEVARKFLEDEKVRDAPREKKVEFLKSKNMTDFDIELLLGEEPAPPKPKAEETPVAAEAPSQSTSTQTTTTATTPTHSLSADRAPIVTYPEFLAKPASPPPLVTTERLLNTLYGIVGLSTLVYGTGKYVVGPMVDAQVEARAEYHDTTARNLDALVSKLEKVVSVIPPKKSAASADVDEADNQSEADDPSEMFHRDMGTQTSFPISTAPLTATDSKNEPTTKRQAERLASITKSLSGAKDQFRSQSEKMDGIKTMIDDLRDDLDTLTYEGKSAGSFDLYGRSRKPEPEDEIRKVRDNIRRVKGVLLSTRNFPATAR